jgi:predicted transcriptional regulator
LLPRKLRSNSVANSDTFLLEVDTMTTTRGINLDQETQNRLKVLAVLRGRSPRWLMKTAILEYLDREEAFEREKKEEDEERWERYQLTGESMPHEQVAAWLEGVAVGKSAP